jgi:hypothetical protein
VIHQELQNYLMKLMSKSHFLHGFVLAERLLGSESGYKLSASAILVATFGSIAT